MVRFSTRNSLVKSLPPRLGIRQIIKVRRNYMEEMKQKIKDWKDWCNNDEDVMNDHIRDFFNDNLSKADLFQILTFISN